jgi:SAM-dependent methyltransferase
MQAEAVLDFGCGNAHYLNLLARMFPDKQYFGIEADDEMRKVAQLSAGKNVTILGPSDDPMKLLPEIDFYLFRLVLLHLPDREVAYRYVTKRASPKAAALVIDADDEHFLIVPPPTLFLGALAQLRAQSKNRSLLDVSKKEFEKLGFQCAMELRLVINSGVPHVKPLMEKYMFHTAELGVGSPLPAALRDELWEWSLMSDAYAQYGVFGQLFVPRS